MVKQSKKAAAEKATGAPLSNTIKESAQQIWLAGLGAFSKAQEEGSKVFDALVKEGTTIQRKTQTVAEERINQATSRMASMASDLSSRASGQWGKLENIFEDRVAKALGKLGVPTAKDMDALTARIDELHRKVSALSPKAGSARRGAAGAVKSAAKRASPRKSA